LDGDEDPAPPRHRRRHSAGGGNAVSPQRLCRDRDHEIARSAARTKGSLYHYFPDGKDQIAEAAVRFAGAGVVATLEKLEKEHDSASAMIRAYWQANVAGWMASQVLRRLPDLDHLLDRRRNPPLSRRRSRSLRRLCAVIARALVRDGLAS